jgi:DNA helicase II / ATP-dependent DNA helicase PcrA
VQLDPAYQPARVPGKQSLVAAAPHAGAPHPPILGMFRADCPTLANDVTQFLHTIFRGHGFQLQCAGTETYTIDRAPGGDFGDAVLLARSVQEYAHARPGQQARERLPLLLRNNLDNLHHVSVFNPRGRNLYEIHTVRQLLGLTLLCIDGNGTALQGIQTMQVQARARLQAWRTEANTFAQVNPMPGGLQAFIQHWGTRTVQPGQAMANWPSEWPLLDLIYRLLTWIPALQNEPEGQVYLEAITRTIAEAGQFASFGSRILHGTQYDQASVTQAIREVFENIANGNVEVDEEIMPHVPRSYFPIMTIHQAKGLEFPLVIVDIGSDFRTNNEAQRRLRFPEGGDTVHLIEDLIAPFCPIGPARAQRPAIDRAWDDMRRLYFVAYSRPENVVLLVGLTSQTGPNPRVRSAATGDLQNGQRQLTLIPASEWHSGLPPGHIALI